MALDWNPVAPVRFIPSENGLVIHYIAWTPPFEDSWKLNFAGCANVKFDKVGVGCVLRDQNAIFKHAVSAPVIGCTCTIEIELEALRFGLCEAVNLGIDYLEIEGESETAMRVILGHSGPLAAYYKFPLNRVVVFHDDMDLPCGVLRLHHKGGHGSHNGLKSVIFHFRGNREFARLRIGIGRPPGQMDPKAFLLQNFNATAQGRIEAALLEGVDALKQLVSKGLTESARCFNTQQKYKHIRSQNMPV